MMLHTKYQSSRLSGFRQEDFFTFPYVSLCKACDPWSVTIFGPRGLICTELVEVYQIMLHTKYQGFGPCGFIKKMFSCFSP